MVDFGDSNERKRWLASQGSDVAAVFAARAALRAVPTLALASSGGRSRGSRREAILRSFRAVASAWTTAAYPGYRKQLSEAAKNALHGMSNVQAPLPERAFVYAAAAASSEATDSDPRDYAAIAVDYAIEAIAHISPEAIEVTLAALSTDADLLDRRFDPVTIALSQLWPGRLPDRVREHWLILKNALNSSNENWVVWTDWYDERLKGGAADQTIEVARVTIPDKIWDQGPVAVNGQIRQYFEERGIWRHAIAYEIDTPVDLTQLSLEVARVIGARAALRVVPLLPLTKGRNSEGERALTIFRVVSAAWAIAKFTTLDRTRDELAVVGESVKRSAPGIIFGVAQTISPCAASSMNRDISSAFARGVDDLRTSSLRLEGPAAGSMFDLALKGDLNDLLHATPGEVAGITLWPGDSRPEWLTRRWQELKNDLIAADSRWQVWVQWYEDRMAGNLRVDARELTYVGVPEQFWSQGPAKVNTWILDQLEDLETPDSQPSDFLSVPNVLSVPDVLQVSATAPAPPVPAQQPAAIEPVWRKRRLTLPKTSTKTNLTGRKFIAALKILRQEMSAFATDISSDANIDRRFATYVSQVAGQIPNKAPTQHELFQLGHAQAVFGGYSKTVNDEWSPILAARFHALSLQFDHTIRQSPLWREFKRNAARDALTTKQVLAAGPLASEVASALRDDEARNLIDPAIPQTLEQVAKPLRREIPVSNEQPDDVIEAGKDLLAYDVVESVNNILKAIFQAAISVHVSTIAKEASAAFGTEAHKSIVKEAGRLGKNVGPALTKWTRRLIFGGLSTGGSYLAGKPLIEWLISNYPETFSWLQAVVHFL